MDDPAEQFDEVTAELSDLLSQQTALLLEEIRNLNPPISRWQCRRISRRAQALSLSLDRVSRGMDEAAARTSD